MSTAQVNRSRQSVPVLNRVFKVFAHRDFRIMWMGACTSSIGTFMQQLAQAWLVYELSKSAFLLGLDAFLGQIPIFLFSLIGGVVADRTERRKLVLASQLIQMTCAFTLTGLFMFHAVHIWEILVLSFFTGFGQAFGGPAYAALLPTLVGAEDLANAIAFNSIQINIARVIGPTLGGITLANWGATWCFFLNGLSFIAVIISLLMVRARYVPGKSSGSLLHSLKEGIAFIRNQEAMQSLIVLAFLMTMLAFPIVVFLPVFAASVLHGNSNTYTVLLCSSGVGSIAGALMIAGHGHMRNQGRRALEMLIALGGTMTAFSLSKNLVVSCVFLFLSGAALISVFTTISSLVQLITADQMRGRVMSVYNVAFRGGMPFGSLVIGYLVPRLTAPVALASCGVLLAGLGFYFLALHRRIAAL